MPEHKAQFWVNYKLSPWNNVDFQNIKYNYCFLGLILFLCFLFFIQVHLDTNRLSIYRRVIVQASCNQIGRTVSNHQNIPKKLIAIA